MSTPGGNQKNNKHNELEQALKECEEYLSRFIHQQKKIHRLVHNSSDPCHNLFFNHMKDELHVIRLESKKRVSNSNTYYSWVKEKKAQINVKTKFYALSFSDMGKFIGKHNIDPPPAENGKILSSESSVLPLDVSQISTTGRPSIVVPSNVFEGSDDFDDFLNRSTRSASSRCKLDSFLLDTSITAASGVQQVKDNFVNERFVSTPSVKLLEDVSKKKTDLSELDSTESELLEDVVAPNITLNFTMSEALNAYAKKQAIEGEAWHKYTQGIQTLEFKMTMVQQCFDIVWNLKMKVGYISEEDALSWKDHLELYSAPKLFDENSDSQKLYSSEWLATLGDVLAIGASVFPKNKAQTLPLDEEKKLFFNLCKKKIVDSCRSTRVENTSKQINWDNEAHRKYAHDLILERYD